MAIKIKRFGINGLIPEEYKVTWKDLVCIGNKVYAEEFPISDIVDIDNGGGFSFDISDFIYCVAGKYGCSYDDVKLWSELYDKFDEGADSSTEELAFGVESVGAYINGVAAEEFELYVED